MNREIGESIARNTTIMLAAQAVTWVSGFILLLFLPRYLGSEDYGRLYLAMSMGMIINIIIDFGGNYLIPKEISRSKDKTARILVSYLGVRSMLWLICMGGVLLFSYLVGYSPLITLLIIIFGLFELFGGGSKAIRSCFQGHEKMIYPSIGVVAERTFIAMMAVAALLLGAGSVEIAIIMVAGAFLNLIICFRFVPIIVKHLPPFRFDVSLKLLKNSLPYFMWSIFAVIYFRIDAVMLSTLTSEEVVGWYGGAYKFFDMVMFLPVILTTAIFPIFSKLQGEPSRSLAETFQQSLKLILGASIPMFILFFTFSEHMVSLFYGLEEYGPSVLVLQIFSLGIILVYVDFILGSAILATNRQRAWAVVGFAAILLNVGLNFLMIPYTQQTMGNGGVGAALTTLATELFIMICAFLMLPRSYYRKFDLTIPLRCVLAGIIMCGVLWYVLPPAGLHWILQAMAGGVTYLILLFLSGVINRQEIHFLIDFFSNKLFQSSKITNQNQEA